MLDLSALRRECERTILFLDELESAALAHSIDPLLVWSRCEDERARDARAQAWTRLHDAGWSWSFIARVFDRETSTVREVVLRRQGIKRDREAA